MGRYLTPSDKARELEEWYARLAEWDGIDRPGRGHPDHAMLPVADRLNRLEGVCTLQSCAGHDDSDGCLWLWLSVTRSAIFFGKVYDLARTRPVLQVSAIWGRCGEVGEREVIEVIFERDRAEDIVGLLCAALRGRNAPPAG